MQRKIHTYVSILSPFIWKELPMQHQSFELTAWLVVVSLGNEYMSIWRKQEGINPSKNPSH